MADLFHDARIIDAIILLIAFEAVALVLLRQVFGIGPAASQFAFNLAAGSALLLALHAALTGMSWMVMALFLLVALAAHLLDMRNRFLQHRNTSNFERAQPRLTSN